MAGDERVQLDNLAVAMEKVDCKLPGNKRGYGRNVHIRSLLAHHVGGDGSVWALRLCEECFYRASGRGVGAGRGA